MEYGAVNDRRSEDEVMRTNRILWLSAIAACAPAWAQQPAPEATQTSLVIRTDVQEVVVDLLASDKKGNPITDLKPSEVRLFEQDKPQEIVSFRRVDRGDVEKLAGEEGVGGRVVGGRNAAGTQLRVAQLVTFVFERLGNNARQLAYKAARDFLESDLNDNVYVAVYVLDRKLYPLQEYTNDHAKLQEAIETATNRNKTNFISESENVEARLQEFLRKTNAPTLAQALDAVPNSQGPPDIDALLARKSLEIAQYAEQLSRDAEAGGSIFGLMGLVRQQGELAGRKTVVLFSEGFSVGSNYTSFLDGLLSEANRAQVSFYGVDARGLRSGSDLDAARRQLDEATSASRAQQSSALSSSQGGITRDQAMAFDTAQSSIRSNSQGVLQEMATKTGGRFVGNTNNLSKPLLKLSDDLGLYYEVSYRPPSGFDGSFRELRVTVDRPDVAVTTRNGYYAVPPTDSDVVVFPFEMPLISQFSNDPLPSALDFHVNAYQFRKPSGEPMVSVVAETPLSDFTFNTATVGEGKHAQQTYNARLTMLSQLRTPDGRITSKGSQDLPLSGEIERLDGVKKANFVFLRHWETPPGRYTLETAVEDRLAESFGAKKVGVVVAAPEPGVAVSSLALIKRVDPKPEPPKADEKKGEEAEPAPEEEFNPFVFSQGKIVPATATAVSRTGGGSVSFYFVIYPDAKLGEPPTLTMQYFLNGQLVGEGAPALPAPEENGTIPYIATTPASAFPVGEYMMSVTIAQGGGKAERKAFFSIVE